jgi:hypothetical protein
MAPPSQIAIATSSVTRLVKEEASYHKELVNQESRLDKLVKNEDGDENKEYQIKQEVRLLSHFGADEIYGVYQKLSSGFRRCSLRKWREARVAQSYPALRGLSISPTCRYPFVAWVLLSQFYEPQLTVPRKLQ